MRGSIAGCTAAIVTLVMATGCGSGHKTLTNSQYIARAQAVCRALERKLQVVSTNENAFPPKIREAIRARQLANEQLRALSAPSSEKVASEWLHWREVAVSATQTALESKPGSAANAAAGKKEHEATEKARALARSAALPACARVA
jgi:hypothetical protein